MAECSWLKASGQPCRRWSCPGCASLLNADRVRDARRGLARANADGETVRLLTLTTSDLKSVDKASVRDLAKRWDYFLRQMKAKGLWADHFIAVRSFDPRTGLHIHALTIGGPFIPRAKLTPLLQGARLGWSDVRRVGQKQAGGPVPVVSAEERFRVSGYLGKNARSFADAARSNSVTPIHPWSVSRT